MRSFLSQSSLALLAAALVVLTSGCQTTGGWGAPKWNSLSKLNPMNWGKKNSALASNDSMEPQPPSISHTPTQLGGGSQMGPNYASGYGAGGSGTRDGYANSGNPSQRFPSAQTGGYDAAGPYTTGATPNQPPSHSANNYADRRFYNDGGGRESFSDNDYRTADQRGAYNNTPNAGYGAQPGYSPNASPSFGAPPPAYNGSPYNGGAPSGSPPPSNYNYPSNDSGGMPGGYNPADNGNYGAPGGFGSSSPSVPAEDTAGDTDNSIASNASLPSSLMQRGGNYAPGSTRSTQLASAAGMYGSRSSSFDRGESESSPAQLSNSTSYGSPSGADSSFPLQ